jgi:hypothetical protein
MSDENVEPQSVRDAAVEFPWKSWKGRNPKGRIGSAIGITVFGALTVCAWLWWPFYTVVLFGLLEALSALRFYQEWVENGAWAK